MRFAITILAIAAWFPVLASPARAEDPPTSFLDREMAYTHKAGSADVTVEAFVKSLGPGTWEADPGDGGYIYRASRFDQLTAATHTSAWLLIVDATGSVQVPRAVMDGIEQPLLGFSAVAQAASLPSRPSLPAEISGTVQPVPAAPPDDSRSVLNTLERLRSLRQQTDTSTSPTRPRGPERGVSLRGSDNASLSAVQRGAVGEKVRDCWTRDAGVLHADTFQVHPDRHHRRDRRRPPSRDRAGRSGLRVQQSAACACGASRQGSLGSTLFDPALATKHDRSTAQF